MDEIVRTLRHSVDLEQMTRDVLELALNGLGFDRVWLLYPCDPEAPVCRLVMELTPPDATDVDAELAIDPETAAMFRSVLASSGPLFFCAPCERPLPAEIMTRFGVGFHIAMAIRPNFDRAYLLGLHQRGRPRALTSIIEKRLQEVGRRLEGALTSLSLFRSLNETRRRLEEIEHLAHIGYWDRDLDANRSTWSEETLRIFGWPEQPRIKDLASLLELVHADDRRLVLEASTGALAGGAPYDLEYRIVRPSGEVRIVHGKADVARDEAGRPRRMFGTVEDITERRLAENALLDATERFRVLAELSLTGVYLVQGGRFEYVNPALARMFGFSVDELVGRLGPIDLVYPPDREIATESLRRRLDGEAEAVRYELRGMRKDGSVFPIEVHGRRLEQGGKVGVMGTLLDITERRRTEEELRASKSRSDEMQRIAHVGWWERDFRTNRVSLSDEVCRAFGVNAVDLPEWHERWLHLIHSNDRALAAKASAAVLRGGPRYDIEYRVVRPDGDVRIVRSQGDVTWDESGRPLRQFGVLQDITELRRAEHDLRASEARFRTFVDHAMDAFFLHDDLLKI